MEYLPDAITAGTAVIALAISIITIYFARKHNKDSVKPICSIYPINYQ
jgi:hypothetical protein